MKEFDSVNERMERFSSYLDNLYYSGNLKLVELQSFRNILQEIRGMFGKLRAMSLFGFIPKYVRKDMNRLNSELLLMEYNVSLLSSNKFCAV